MCRQSKWVVLRYEEFCSVHFVVFDYIMRSCSFGDFYVVGNFMLGQFCLPTLKNIFVPELQEVSFADLG